MPKVKDKGLPSTWIQNYPELTIENNKIFCRLCMKTISAEKKYNEIQHIQTAIHKQNKCGSKQRTLPESVALATKIDDQKTFAFDLCGAMIAANIPLKKLENVHYRNFLEKYCKREIPSESSLRKNYLDQVYTNVFEQIKQSIGNNHIWISVDETTDSCGRYMANLLVGVLNNEKSVGPFLISCKELQQTNHSTIARFVQESLTNLFLPDRVPNEKILLMVTDAAAYMVKAASVLKVFYENMIYCTCLAHGLARIAETIKLQFPLVNLLIKNGKKIFLKAPLRIQAFKDQLPNVALPPEPILTRWGTWLKAAMCYAEHIEKFKRFVCDLLPATAAISIKECQEVLKDDVLLQNLEFLKANYWYVSKSIQNLENKNLPLVDSVKVVDDFIQHTQDVRGHIGEVVNKKLKDVLLKNEGFQTLANTAKLLRGETVDNFAIPANAFKYAPITLVDVERSFSIYKNILTDRRQSFSPDNLEKYIIINCFYNIFN